MEDQSLSLDIINKLPQDIIGDILGRMPIQDAVRTNVLSCKWRYHLTSILVLEFDDKLFEVPPNSNQDKKSKFFNAIFHALRFHRGPLLQFSLYISELDMSPEVDQIILDLSMNNRLKSFFIVNESNNPYKLPSSLFSFQGLDDLFLQLCVFKPPLTFNGLSGLKSLTLTDVWITTKMLQRLLINCPELKKLVLMICLEEDFTEGNKFTFVELFQCLPSIVHVFIGDYYFMSLARGGMSSTLITTLVHLEIMYLGVCFKAQDAISSLLCLIRSSPNLKKIHISMGGFYNNSVQQTPMNFFDRQDYSNYNLNYLKRLEIAGFHNFSLEMEFLKLIVARSPVLEEVQIKLSTHYIVDELKVHIDLLRHLIPKAPLSAKVIIEG